jgi:hypothetical protein
LQEQERLLKNTSFQKGTRFGLIPQCFPQCLLQVILQ